MRRKKKLLTSKIRKQMKKKLWMTEGVLKQIIYSLLGFLWCISFSLYKLLPRVKRNYISSINCTKKISMNGRFFSLFISVKEPTGKWLYIGVYCICKTQIIIVIIVGWSSSKLFLGSPMYTNSYIRIYHTNKHIKHTNMVVHCCFLI